MPDLKFPQYKQLIKDGYTDQEIKNAWGKDTTIYKGLYKQNFAQPGLKSLYTDQPGPDIPSEYSQSNPYGAGYANFAAQGIINPALDYANMQGLNSLRALVRQAGYKWPEPESLPAFILQKGAGVAGAFSPSGLGNLSMKLGEKVMPEIGSGIARLVGKNPRVVKSFLEARGPLQETLRGVTSGAIGGGLYSDTDEPFNVGKRVGTAGIGAALGAPVGFGGYYAGEAVKGLRGLLTHESPKGTTALEPQQISKHRIELAREAREPSLTRLEDQLGAKQQAAGAIGEEYAPTIEGMKAEKQRALNIFGKRKTQLERRRSIAEMTSDVEFQKQHGANISDLEGRLNDLSTNSSGQAPEVISTIRKDLNTKYGELLSEAGGDNIVTLEDMQNVVTKTKDRLVELGLPTSEIDALDVGKETSTIKDFISKIRGKNVLGSKIKTGNYVRDDVQKLALQQSLGDFLEGINPAFKVLNQSYRPMIEATKKLSSKIKPGALFERQTFANELKGIAKGKTTTKGRIKLDTEQQIEQLAKGTEKLPGYGDVFGTESIDRAAQELDAAGKALSDIKLGRSIQSVKNKTALEDKYENLISSYSDTVDGEITSINKLIESKKQLNSQEQMSIERKIQVIRDDLAARIKDIRSGVSKGERGVSERAILKLIKQKGKIEKTWKVIAVGTAALGGIGGAIPLIRTISNKR